MKTTPFWTDDYPRPSDLPVAAELPSKIDVAIIGGGYTGLSAARTLAKGGTSVVVLERETIGWGASSRNAGIVSSGLKAGMINIFKRYGKEYGLKFWQASLDMLDLIKELEVEEGIDFDLYQITHTWTGHLGLTFDLMPNIGVEDGIHYSFGYGGKGLHTALYLGREIAWLLTGKIKSSPFMEIPHQTYFFYRNKPWFLPFAVAFYRFRDWLS